MGGFLFSVLNPMLLPRILWQNRSLLKQTVRRTVAGRYRGSVLGIFWSFAQPLLMLLVYTFVFSVVFKMRWGGGAESSRGAFAIVMFCGLAIFNIFSECVSSSCSLVTGNPNYVKKVVYPLEILPAAQTISSFLLGSVWFVLLFFGAIFVFGKISWTMLLIFPVLLPLVFFTFGISCLVASLEVYIRDTHYVVGVVLQILFFMTPIFYPLEAVPQAYRWPLLCNPLTVLIGEARKVFLFGECPDWGFWALALAVSLAVAQLGFWWFRQTKKGFADVL